MTKPKRGTFRGIAIYIPEELHRNFKKACIDNGRSQKDVLREFVEAYSEQEKGTDEGHSDAGKADQK